MMQPFTPNDQHMDGDVTVEQMTQLQAAVAQGAMLLVVGPFGPAKAHVIKPLIPFQDDRLQRVLVLDQHGDMSDISRTAQRWDKQEPGGLASVLPTDGSIYPVVHALYETEHYKTWLHAARFYGGIATTYPGLFTRGELIDMWTESVGDQGRPAILVIIDVTSHNRPHLAQMMTVRLE